MKPFENIVEKGKNAGNQHFLLFPLCFLPYQIHKFFILHKSFHLQMLGIQNSVKFFVVW